MKKADSPKSPLETMFPISRKRAMRSKSNIELSTTPLPQTDGALKKRKSIKECTQRKYNSVSQKNNISTKNCPEETTGQSKSFKNRIRAIWSRFRGHMKISYVETLEESKKPSVDVSSRQISRNSNLDTGSQISSLYSDVEEAMVFYPGSGVMLIYFVICQTQSPRDSHHALHSNNNSHYKDQIDAEICDTRWKRGDDICGADLKSRKASQKTIQSHSTIFESTYFDSTSSYHSSFSIAMSPAVGL